MEGGRGYIISHLEPTAFPAEWGGEQRRDLKMLQEFWPGPWKGGEAHAVAGSL